MLPEFPFAYDEYDMPMNTRALATECGIEVSPLYRQELDEKSAILASDHRYYCQAPVGAEAMQWEAIAHLLPVLARHYPEHFSLAMDDEVWHWSNHLLGTEARLRLGHVESLPTLDHLGSPLPDPASRPLDWLARQVQEDLILMSGDPETGTPMLAGHLCFGGSWCLDDKMGKSFLAIHDEVPQFSARIGRPAHLVMQRLKAERPIGRVNWSISTTSRRNMAPRFAHLALPTRRNITSENAGERCFLRLERQTLSRLPRTGGILFTIHTTITPLNEVVADPERLRRLTNVIKGIPRPTREYKGMAGYIDALVDYLEGRCRQASGSPPTTAAKLNRDGGAERGHGPQLEAPSQGEGWEPWPLDPQNVLAGEPRPRVRWVRRSGFNQPWHRAGWLELDPSVTRMLCDGLQTFLIEQGELTITGEDGVPVRLGAGEASVPDRDTVSIWTISAPLRCFFSYSK